MNCTEWEERIALYAGGDLPPADAASVEEHLAGCPGCQVLLSGLRSAILMLADSHEETVNEAHYAAVRARVLSRIERPWWKTAWVWAAVAAALVVALMLPGRRTRQDVAPPRAPVTAGNHSPAAPQAPVAIAGPAVPQRAPSVRRRTRPAPKEVAKTNEIPADPLVVKLITDDPDVIIYWITNTKGE